MALTQFTDSVENISGLENLPNDTTGLTATEVKALFDKAGIDIKDYINNTLLSELSSTTANSSGANQIGAETLLNKTNVMDILKAIVAAGSGSIPPDLTISNAKMAVDAKIGSLANLSATISDKSSVVNAINEVIADLTSLITAIAVSSTNHSNNATKHIDTVITTQGDIPYHDGTSPTRLAKGSPYSGLIMNATATAQQWANSLQSLITANGDIIFGSSPNTPAILPKGYNNTLLGVNNSGDLAYKSTSIESGNYLENTIITGHTTYTKTITFANYPLFANVSFRANRTGETISILVGQAGYTPIEGNGSTGYGTQYMMSGQSMATDSSNYISFQNIYLSGNTLQINWYNGEYGYSHQINVTVSYGAITLTA